MQRNFHIDWLSCGFKSHTTQNMSYTTKARIHQSKQMYNNNNDRLTAFDPGQPG